MSIAFTPWPEALARRYRERGYWTDRPLTDIITRQAKNDAIALIDPQRSLSYRQLNQLSDRLAAALLRRGIHSGDTALVQLGNVVEFYVTFFALLKIGVVPVNALFSHQRNELNAYAAQIKPALLIADRQHGLFGNDEFLTTFRAEHPSLRLVALRSEEQGEQSLASWLEEDCGDFVAAPTAADQVAFFQLSGGSTGTPKLIPRTHNDYYYSIRRSVEICHFDDETRYLCALPVAHNYPMSSPGVLGVFYGGGLVVFASDPDAGQCFGLIDQHQINVTALVPPAVTLWLQAIEEWGGCQQLASLKLLQVGGAKLGETLAARIPAEIGCQLQQVFGMAEGLVNYTRLDDDEQHILTTQGCPMSPDDELWVADDDGTPLPVGETGRLMTRGPYTFRGYYQSPEHNAAAFDKDGFYCSGDLISLTEDGYVKVEGRQKDQINRGGEKIAAEEIENLLLRHPEVINAALVSMPDELMGEKSCAYIIATSPLKPVVLRRHLRAEGVAEFKLPDRFIQVETLPLTPVGKVDKKLLRQRLEAQQLTQVQGE
ncbi:(2,3-dihydroxybenzoyl)adenylate synthase [Serratia liquefaciens]|uniref:(2,3-dihydroxybenzoyl)adenylate synthase n=1 Tax=Serratia liquefaciens TaxID=614 RepID=UPI000358675B|nr:(2,3-dihydroxybenzoyl)adenylate synthase [Serratia liquefaciens]AGQ32212.1 enterobactin synthase subunit E [Serratia liquefaciens ATCC 27592]CAI0696913.1 2,3-dihydroxybenzoate-AMP ligase [Serratia liquefaciens]CAI2040192.1 2,3-dihydroxybenzoate-AMP ligase [Serratia liquefaciens]CAI2409171.1 2,3-dihydroxybenzoate-AMP ligase [Serratia liquefaciens]HBL6731798.1 (2,3-dihydroxybenzoyl)adenylate synthase [Serratia liquefaciens]